VIVARAGAVAVGTISHASRPGIRGSKGNQGKGREGTTVVLTVLFGRVGLVKHGRNAELSQGTSLTAYVDRDTELSVVE
jgi:hypothetical protein